MRSGKFRLVTQSFADFQGTSNRCVGTCEEHKRHSVATWQSCKLVRWLPRGAKLLSGISDNLIELAQQFTLFVRQQL